MAVPEETVIPVYHSQQQSKDEIDLSEAGPLATANNKIIINNDNNCTSQIVVGLEGDLSNDAVCRSDSSLNHNNITTTTTINNLADSLSNITTADVHSNMEGDKVKNLIITTHEVSADKQVAVHDDDDAKVIIAPVPTMTIPSDTTPEGVSDTAPSADSLASPPEAPAVVASVPANPFKTPFYRVVTDGSRRDGRTKITRTASELLESLVGQGKPMPAMPQHIPVALARYPSLEISVFTDIGGRRTQEDRFTYCPCVGGRDDVFLAGIFDGTVGDFASETVKQVVIPHLVNSTPWPQVVSLLQTKSDLNSSGDTSEESAQEVNTKLFPLLAEAIDEMYLFSDSELIDSCASRSLHYASSTSVVALLAGDCCCVGHLGDSRAALGHFCDGHLYANFITDDHKPNQPHERLRIKQAGGSVEYLHNHNNKPFIRGGDFTMRKSRGEQPMQLQYSRAFGGKDLKMFGLSNEPDVLCFRVESFHSCLILASDGVWDVLTAGAAVKVVVKARLANHDPAAAVVNTVLNEQAARRQNSDNVTAIVIFFATECNRSIWNEEWPAGRPSHMPLIMEPTKNGNSFE